MLGAAAPEEVAPALALLQPERLEVEINEAVLRQAEDDSLGRSFVRQGRKMNED